MTKYFMFFLALSFVPAKFFFFDSTIAMAAEENDGETDEENEGNDE